MIGNKDASVFQKRINSFRYAFRGFALLWQAEINFRIHIMATVLAISAGLIFKISQNEWLAITIVIGMVLVAEGFNTAIERLCDELTREKNHNIAFIKDVSAAAVMLTACTALIVGAIVFLPKIAGWFYSFS